MALSKIPINSASWTLIGNNVTTISYQNVGQQQMYIQVTMTNAAPTNTIGLVYDLFQGELKITPANLSIAGGTYVWARTVTGTGSVIVDI